SDIFYLRCLARRGVDVCDLGSAACRGDSHYARTGTLRGLSATRAAFGEAIGDVRLRLLRLDFLPRWLARRRHLDHLAHLQRSLAHTAGASADAAHDCADLAVSIRVRVTLQRVSPDRRGAREPCGDHDSLSVRLCD